MKKTLALSFILTGLLLASCAKGEAGSSSQAASSLVPETLPYYFATLKTQSYYSKKIAYSLKKGTLSYEEGYSDHEISPSGKIEYRYEKVTSLASLSDNGDTSVSKSTVYETADSVYAYDETDGTYHTRKKSRSEFLAYTLPYDYSLASDARLTSSGFLSTIKGTIAEKDLARFGENKLNGVTDFAFEMTLTKVEGYLQSLTFSYTKDGLSISRSLAVSLVEPKITLPQ